MNVPALEKRDMLFWTPLEEALKKTESEIEAIALDWLYETIECILHQNPILVASVASGDVIITGLLGDEIDYLSLNRIFWLTRNIKFGDRPHSIDGLRKAIALATAAPERMITIISKQLLRIVTSYARSDHVFIRRDRETYIRMTDSRFPFPNMRASIER